MKAEPWLVPAAVTWLEERIKPGWAAFEWGSGGSTLWLEGLCSSVVSVEHDPTWWAMVNSSCRTGKSLVLLCPPTEGGADPSPADPRYFRSSCCPGSFELYAKMVDLVEPDLVIVDGRARASCLARAVARGPKLLVLDNAEREWYLEQTEHRLDGWERTDFWQGEWLTSAWTRG